MADFLEIRGPTPLTGRVQVSGAKNAVLPLLIASLLTSEKCSFENVPDLEDISLLLSLLEHTGGVVLRTDGKVEIEVPTLRAMDASYSLVKALRASFWVLAPLLARGRAARVALPGGDIIGARLVDIHLWGLAQMGADIKQKHGVVYATAVEGLKPAKLDLRFPSVGATHQLLMAAAVTPGPSIINNAAREPEIGALAEMINLMGGDVEGAGTSQIIVRGRDELGGAQVKIIGDRIEAATYLLAAGATGGSLTASGINPDFFGEFITVLDQIGLIVERGPDWISVKSNGRLKATRVATGPFPMFATDIQAPLMAALTLAEGQSIIEEHVFEGRFGHVSELCRLGADIKVQESRATIQGVDKLSGAPVDALDIRAAAALVIAGLAAEGTTSIFEPHHIRRGYESLESKLRGLGASIGIKHQDPEDFVFSGC